ncbi:LysM peptidoglycan-binding domain-containing protein [Staphylococcus equorum]|uniref:LysM peptidoglycan-binding domain-containing protein n=1 Tax=Staphylococcus equorum TaxID=246432 RepID=A0A9X4R2N5_9STAP|nr:LysM domain-containing protein [Staphylococcus equorum]MDG0860306.1 LysM peptidoglycan-binding domain-containing protein [Staphylococcus equorum]
MKKVLMTIAGAGFATALFSTGAHAYTVEEGDTIEKVSTKENVSVETIKELNQHITDFNVIFTGEEIALNEEEKNTIKITERNSFFTPIQEVEVPTITQQELVQPKAISREEVPQPTQAPEIKIEEKKYYSEPIKEEQVQQQPVELKQVEQTVKVEKPQTQPQSTGGSVKDQFLAAGGTEDMWNTIVLPESSGNPNAVNPLGYRGLGQTKEAWGTGSVEEQTKGMINYAEQRYGSVNSALSFRSQNNWW